MDKERVFLGNPQAREVEIWDYGNRERMPDLHLAGYLGLFRTVGHAGSHRSSMAQ